MRVNAEAGNIDEAKGLMHRYMVEFCAEYDKCGYGQDSSRKLSGDSSSFNDAAKQSDNLQGASNDSRSGNQMAFDNKILKKGVRVLSKNLQKASE